MRVEDLMTKDVVTVGADASLKEVATTLAESAISGVPVTSEEGSVLGVVSEADIVLKEKGRPDPRPRGLLGWLLVEPPDVQRKLAARTAGQAMTSPAITIEPGKSVQQAAMLMTENSVNRLPVVDEEQKLIGIVSRNDLVRAFIRSDAEILREIEQDVILHTLWISPERVTVTISKGEVTLSGQVDSKLDAELLEQFVEHVPGVVAVTSKLRWEHVDRPKHGPGSPEQQPGNARKR